MKHSIIAAIGLLVGFVGLWVGAWVFSVLGDGHWARFPTFMTSVLVVFGGVVIFSYGSVLKIERYDDE